MMWILGLFVVLALLAPKFGADSRVSREWKSESFNDEPCNRA